MYLGESAIIKPTMKAVTELDKTKVQFVFTDIDDTLTLDGRLISEAYSAMWKLFEKGIQIVPVTGRPAGWCELIARQWPVAGVIGENGGLYFRLHKNEMQRHFVTNQNTMRDNQRRLDKVRAEVLETVPGSKLASDQFCRMMDLAIDFAEDVTPPLRMEEVGRIVKIFEKHGAVAKVSSIHVNGWYGKYDKLSMCQHFLMKEFKTTLKEAQGKSVFIGDSPNDEPMFEAFDNSVAVSNIKNFIDALEHKPKYLCGQEGGYGFAELAHHLTS